MPLYNCERCGWNSRNKAHFKLHLQRKFICNPQSEISIETIISKYFPELLNTENLEKKYIKNDDNLDNLIENSYSCSFCNKIFQYKQSKWRHEKICQNENKLEPIDDEKIDETISDKEKIKLLIEKLNEEKKRVEDKEKLLSHYEEIINKTITNTKNDHYTTNNTTNNTTINVQINAFGSENISYLSKSFLTQLLKIPYASVPKLLEYIHFNKNFPENHNVKIFSRKEKWAQKHNGTEWEIVPKNSLISDMICNGVNILEVHYEEKGGKQELNDVKRDRWEKFSLEFHEEKPTTIKRVHEDTECLLLNKSTKNKDTNDELSCDDFTSLEEIDKTIESNLETLNSLD